jgi:hypothetical protein
MPDDPNDVIIPASFCYETYKTQIIDLFRGLKDQYLFTDQDGMDNILHSKYHKHIAELTDDLLSAASTSSMGMGMGSKTRNKGAKKMQLQQQQQQPVLSAVRLIEVEHHHNYEHFFSTVVEVLDRVDNKVRL